jgi:hypothetical protein
MRLTRSLLYSGLLTTTAAGAAVFLVQRAAKRRELSRQRGRILQWAMTVPVALGAASAGAALVRAGLRTLEQRKNESQLGRAAEAIEGKVADDGAVDNVDKDELRGVGIGEEMNRNNRLMSGGSLARGDASKAKIRREDPAPGPVAGLGSPTGGRTNKSAGPRSETGGPIGSDLTRGGLRDTHARGAGATDLPARGARAVDGADAATRSPAGDVEDLDAESKAVHAH